MNRTVLIFISLSLSCVGLLVIFVVKPVVSPQLLELSGEVNYVNDVGNVSFIYFVPDNLTVISFKDVELVKGRHTLYGRLAQYKGRVEFVVDSYD